MRNLNKKERRFLIIAFCEYIAIALYNIAICRKIRFLCIYPSVYFMFISVYDVDLPDKFIPCLIVNKYILYFADFKNFIISLNLTFFKQVS